MFESQAMYANPVANGVKLSFTRAVDDSKPILVWFSPDSIFNRQFGKYGQAKIRRVQIVICSIGVDSTSARVADIFAYISSRTCLLSNFGASLESINSVVFGLNIWKICICINASSKMIWPGSNSFSMIFHSFSIWNQCFWLVCLVNHPWDP